MSANKDIKDIKDFKDGKDGKDIKGGKDNDSSTKQPIMGASGTIAFTKTAMIANAIAANSESGPLARIDVSASLDDIIKVLDEKTNHKICLVGSRAASFLMDDKFREISKANDYDFFMTPKACKSFLDKNKAKISNFSCESVSLRAVDNTKSKDVKDVKISESESDVVYVLNHYKMIMTIDSRSIEVEVPIAKECSSALFFKLCNSIYVKNFSFLGIDATIPQLILLERLKWTHIYWPINFQKHIKDMHAIREHIVTDITKNVPWLKAPTEEATKGVETIATVTTNGLVSKAKGIENNENLLISDTNEFVFKTNEFVFKTNEFVFKTNEFVQIRRKEHTQMYGDPSKHINLNKTNEDFLDKEPLNVERLIPHDDIHKLVMFGNVPKYTLIKVDQSKAKCDVKLFDAFPLLERLQNVQEEAMTLALERLMLPERETDSQKAYMRALEKVCTTTTKGWYRDFALDHYIQVKDCPKDLRAIAIKVIESYHEKKKKEMTQEFSSRVQIDPNKEWFNDEELDIVEEIVMPENLKIKQTSEWYSSSSSKESDDNRNIDYIIIYGKRYKLCVSEVNVRDEGDCASKFGSSLEIDIMNENDKRCFYYVLRAVHETGNYSSNHNLSSYEVSYNTYNDYDKNFPKQITGSIMLRLVIQNYNFKDFHNTDANMAITDLLERGQLAIRNYFNSHSIPLEYRDNDIYRASLTYDYYL